MRAEFVPEFKGKGTNLCDTLAVSGLSCSTSIFLEQTEASSSGICLPGFYMLKHISIFPHAILMNRIYHLNVKGSFFFVQMAETSFSEHKSFSILKDSTVLFNKEAQN